MLALFDVTPLAGAVAGAAAGAARSAARSVTSAYDTTRRVRNVARNALTGGEHWKAGQRLHLALRHPDGEVGALARQVAEELVEHPDVLTAYWDGGLSRLVVTVAEDAATDLVTERATELATRFGLAEGADPTARDTSHPGDPTEVRVTAAAILMDAAGTAGALAGRSLRLPPSSRIITATVTLLRENPRFRALLRQRFGASGMELVLAAANAAAHGIGQTPLALVLDGILRGNQLTEAVARAAAFETLHDDVCHHRRTSLPCPVNTRPPLKVTPAAEYASHASTGSLAGAAATLLVTHNARDAAEAVLAGSPKAARYGPAAFGATLGTYLAHAGILLRNGERLRQLEIARKLVGQGPHQAMLRATLIGFFAELMRQVDDPKVRDRLSANFAELITSKSLDEMQTGFSAGSAVGLVSPVTDFFGLMVLAEHLRHFAESLVIGVLKNETDLIEEAKSLAKDFGDLLGSMADTLAGMFKEHPEGLVGVYQHLEQEGVRRAGEQGRLAARKVIGSLTSKEEAKPVETLGQIVGTHTESEKMGAASAVSGKLSRVQEAIFHTRPARVGYGVGEALGAVVGNLLVMAFTEGVGSAITEIAGKLGRAAPMLARAAEFLAEVGKAISAVENAIGTLIEALLKKVKILGKIFQPFLDLMLRLQTFLQKLTGVAHRLETAVAKGAVTAVREAAPAAQSAGMHAAEAGAPKATGNVVDIRDAAAKRAAKGAAAKKPAAGKPATGKRATAGPARQTEHKAAAESGVFPAARQSEHAAQGEGVVEFKRTGTTDQPVAVSPGSPARRPGASSPGSGAPKPRIATSVKPRLAPAAKAPGGTGPKPGGTQRPKKAAAPAQPKGPVPPRLCRVDELGTPGVTPMQRGRYHVPGAPGEFDHRLIQMARETRAGRAGVSLQDFSRTNIATARISHGPGGPVEYLASPNIPGSALGLERGFDSEQLLIQRAVDLRKAGMKVTLDQLYTERIPCPACTRLLAQYFPEAKVFYTVGTTGRLRMYGDLSRGRALMRAYGMLGDQ
ncbi:hypothetical protein [Streptomyces massasporeus]|uniref:hypothetical protein n=1 Tax=Streptomyces massasporeus TaxID=67324 RepID=UPI00332C0E5D